MSIKLDPAVVVAISSVLIFVKDLDDGICPMMGGFSWYPTIGKDVVKALGECGVVDFQEFGRETTWSNIFPI